MGNKNKSLFVGDNKDTRCWGQGKERKEKKQLKKSNNLIKE